MCAIENLALLCRRNRNQEMTTPGIFTYGTVTIRFDPVRPRSGPVFTHNIACAVMRGLPEYMTLSDWWVESRVHIVSEDYIIGTAKVWNSQREGSVAPVALVGLQNSTGSDATA